jgi:hypothetical protein
MRNSARPPEGSIPIKNGGMVSEQNKGSGMGEGDLSPGRRQAEHASKERPAREGLAA